MIISPKPTSDLHFNISNSRLDRVREFKYPGLTFQDIVKFNLHISYVASKISQPSGILYCLRDYLTQHTMRILYFSISPFSLISI